MQRSHERVLTTHAGSLPRPADVLQYVEGHDQREVSGNPEAERAIEGAIVEVVKKQLATGIDVISDGEMGRVGFSVYATERLTGFDGPPRPMEQVERSMFPEYFEAMPAPRFPSCNGPIKWRGPEWIQRDIATLRSALAGLEPTEVFMPAVSPGQIWLNFRNEHYASEEDYVMAAAGALANEYRAIVEAGFVLQLDDPGLAMGWNQANFADKSLDDYRRVVAQHVEAINVALKGIPPDRVRLHVCWGNAEWPHVRDVPLAEIIDILYGVKADGIYVEGANPRHEHEWRVFMDHKLPDGKLLVAGVIDSVTNFVEHPDLVAERVARFASVVGRQNFIAGTDCGFGTFARSKPRVHPTIVWEKLGTLAEGARRATRALFGSSA